MLVGGRFASIAFTMFWNKTEACCRRPEPASNVPSPPRVRFIRRVLHHPSCQCTPRPPGAPKAFVNGLTPCQALAPRNPTPSAVQGSPNALPTHHLHHGETALTRQPGAGVAPLPPARVGPQCAMCRHPSSRKLLAPTSTTTCRVHNAPCADARPPESS